jgi:hypothetical protein
VREGKNTRNLLRLVGAGITLGVMLIAMVAAPQMMIMNNLGETTASERDQPRVPEYIDFITSAEEPDLEVTLYGPNYAEIGTYTMYNATVENTGNTTETNLQLSFYLDDGLVGFTTITSLAPLETFTDSYSFLASEVGIQELRATIEEVPDEVTYENNQDSKLIIVSTERKYAIFQDRWPWNAVSTATVLSMQGISYDIYGSSSMGIVDLSNYTRVIISSSQPNGFRQRVYDNLTWFEDYTANGGILEVHAADQTDEQWVNGAMPGGVTYVHSYEELVNIASSQHQIMNIPQVYTDEVLDSWGSSMHGYLANVSPNANLILNSKDGHPVLVEFPYSSGHIIITTQTVEFAYQFRNIHFLENLLLYRPVISDHDVFVSLMAPPFVSPTEETVLNMSVYNWGSHTENDVVVTVHANEELIYSHTIASLENGTTFSVEIHWTPAFPGTYELTAYVEPVTGEENIENNEMTRTVLSRPIRGKILWDVGHGNAIPGDSSILFWELYSSGYIIEEIAERFNETLLAHYSVIVSWGPGGVYWENETDSIQTFVSNGGGLLVMDYSGHEVLNNLTMFAGIEWYPASAVGGTTSNITPHAVTEGVDSMYVGYAEVRLNVSSPAVELIYMGTDTFVAASQVGAGRVVAIADYYTLLDFFIMQEGNLRLGNNIIEWLTEEYQYNEISNIVQDPTVVNPTQSVIVTCDVISLEGIASVELHYRVDGGSWQSVQMILVSGTTYQGTIPAQSSASLVEYYVTATNVLDFTNVNDNEGDFYSYTVTTPTTTTTPTTSPTTTPVPGPDMTMMIVIIAGAVGAVIIVLLVVLGKKKKSG